MASSETDRQLVEVVVDDSKPLVIVADEHEVVRNGITAHIETECNVTVVADTSDGYETIKSVRQLNPDLLMIDLGLQRPAGTDVLRKINSLNPDIKIIVVASDSSLESATFALLNGAEAFLPKQSSSRDFVLAVNAVLNGFSYWPKDVMSHFMKPRLEGLTQPTETRPLKC